MKLLNDIIAENMDFRNLSYIMSIRLFMIHGIEK